MRALFKSFNLIGDGIYVSQALNLWHQSHKDWLVDIQTHADHTAALYSRMGVPIDKFWFIEPIGDYDFTHTFDVSAAFKLCDEKKIHIAEAYAQILGVELKKMSDEQFDFRHLKPIFIPTPEELRPDEQGVVLVSMFSASCASREGKPPNKMLPWKVWQVIVRYLRTLGYPLRFMGGPKDRTEHLDISEEEYMLGVPLNRSALIMQKAKVIVTVDNGLSHLAASQETPTFLFYPECLGEHYILPKGNFQRLAYLHMNPMLVKAEDVVTVMKNVIPDMIVRFGR